jgi:YidC/Oxa1 family membrane protein insertase
MAVLNISLLASFLVDMWIGIIGWLNASVANYALAIIVLTLIIKLVLSPLDFFNKKVTRKNAKMQQIIQPQLEKLEKKYGNDKSLYNQKMSELYKQHNYNVVGSCLFMLINLVVTFTVFISLLNGLNTMASRKITSQYANLQQTYHTVYEQQIELGSNQEQATAAANEAVVIKYQQIQDSFLWINNVWKPDTTTNSIPTFDEYLALANTVEFEGEQIQVKKLTQEQKDTLKAEYELIMNPIRDQIGRANGYYILLVLVVGTAVLAQWLSQRKLSLKDKDKNATNPAASTNKIMMFVLPVILGVFALSSNSVFSLYLLTSQIITIAITPIVDLLIDKTEKAQEQKTQLKTTPAYSRENINFEKTPSTDKPKTKKQSNQSQKGE